MIRRGTKLSRALAVGCVLGPPLIGLALFATWALDRWIAAGARIETAEQERHAALARAAQARLYEPLGEAWREYAATEVSGLSQTPDAAAGQAAMAERLRAVLTSAGAEAPTLTPLPLDSADGLERIRLEARAEIVEAALPALMAAVEAEAPHLFVDRFEAELLGDPAAGADDTRLAVRLRVSTFRLEEADE